MSKPKCELIGKDGNAYAIIFEVMSVLKKERAVYGAIRAKKFGDEANNCKSYEDLLRLVHKYVEVV